MLYELEIDCARECDRIVTFTRGVLAEAGYSRLVVNLSGGLDSALTAALSVRAVGRENVRAMILPYRTSNPSSEAHAVAQAEELGIRYDRFDITPLVEPFVARYPDIDDRRKGNIMARARMIVLFDQAAAFHALAAGTSNRTELLLGYFTIFGDGAASFEPIGHLYKCQVRALARHVGVIRDILEKAPSADLWQGQTDEAELGFSYAEADAILYLLTERHESPESIVARGYERTVVDAIIARMRATEFKRRPVPILSAEGRNAPMSPPCGANHV